MIAPRWIIIGLSLSLAAMYGAWSVQVSDLRADHALALNAEKDKTAAQKKLYNDLAVAMARNVAAAATARAADLNAALDRASELQEENNRLRASYAATSKER